MKRPTLTIALTIALALGVAVLAVGFSTPEIPRVTTPPIRLHNQDERYASLDALRDAWLNRPLDTCAENQKAERRFLNRMIFVLKHTRHTESYTDACNLWNTAYHDHTSQYDDDFLGANR